MKKLLFVLLFLFAAGNGVAETESYTSVEERASTLSPCRYWRNTTSGGYLCSSYAFSMRVPDARDVDAEIRRLENRIRRLESRLVHLESQ